MTKFFPQNRRRFGILIVSGFILLGSAAAVTAQRGRRGGETVEVDAAKAATIKGTVTVDVTPPKNRPVNMSADPKCVAAHADTVFEEKILANDSGQIQEAFVFISTGLEGMSFPTNEEAAVLDQVGCMYRPSVLGLQTGQKLEIINSDDTLHNVHALNSGGDIFNLAMPKQGMVIKQEIRKPCAMVKVKCDIHPWMFAYIGVLEHPYFDTTDETGAFEIPNLPAGTYTVSVFQRRLGWLSAELTVGESQTAELQFVYTR